MYHRISCFFVLSLLGSMACGAAAAPALSPPAKARREVEASMAKCLQAVKRHTPVGNQLVSEGLYSCYGEGRAMWESRIEQAKQRLAASAEPNCRQISEQLESAWTKYNEEVSQLPSLGAAPLNTVDDAQLLLLAHRYEVLYVMTGPYICPLGK